MRKLIILLWLLMGAGAFAQQYNNEWIDFSKVYYKFKIADSGLYRISQATINSAGLGTVPAEQFKLFRNGVEIVLYTSIPTGALPANGYIQFWGEPNDGKADKALYRNPAYQHSDKVSLQSDTATYFLTTAAGLNLRIADVANNVANNTLPVTPYFMYTTGRYFREIINPGYAEVVGEYVYSSSYDKGEFWSTRDINPSTPRTDVLNNLFVYPGAADAPAIKYGASGNAQNTRTIKLALNGSLVKEYQVDYFNDAVVQAPFPISLMSSNTASVQFANTSSTGTDRMVISFYEISYPRLFNFGGNKQFAFELAAKNEGYYLEITNFNFGSQPPVLYDLAYRQRFKGEVSGNITRFVLPGNSGANRKLVLVSEDVSAIKNVSTLTPKSFLNFKDAANQGDYLIISNTLLFNGTNGINPVEQYKNYRMSVAGGSFRAHIYDIEELVDQFAYGIKKHPLSIKNFLRFARANFSPVPKYTFLIGKGVSYNEYRLNQADPLAERLNLIPAFGNPASDNMLSSPDVTSSSPLTLIGRLSVVNVKELEDYLEKVKEYENVQQTATNTIQDRLWMKNIIHVTGASDSYLGTVLCNYMESYKLIAEDTLIGSDVTVFCKSSTNPVEQLSNNRIADLFKEGLSLVTYFGHSSSTTLEFNLDDPQNYTNQGKYPVFSVNGCNAGNFFKFDPQRFTFNETLSEKFVLAKQRGGIAFIASTHLGIVNYLNVYLDAFYHGMGSKKYGASLGELNRDALQKVVSVSDPSDFFARIQAEEVTLHGDPALKMNFEAQPDYIIEEPQVKISPAFISIAENKFDLAVKLFNLGRSVKDSIVVEIKRQYPNGNMEILYRKKIKGIYYSDSINLVIPVVATRDKGQNKIIVTVDADNQIAEVSETNNTVTKDFFIFEDEAKTAYPYDFAIVNNSNQKLYASTANPFSSLKQYLMEIDTTELFNSPAKVIKNLSSVGGILEFDPAVAFRDSTVYYWRVALVPPAGTDYRWNASSFIYLKGNSVGFNQSHYYQHLKSDVERISLEADRNWKYGDRINNLFIRNTMYPTGGREDNEFTITVNGQTNIRSACVGHSLIFNVFDRVTFKPWLNVDENGNNLFRFNSGSANCAFGRQNNFEFSYMTSESRKNMMDFMDSIPAGSYVVVRSIDYDNNKSFSSTWRADTLQYGSNNSLYHKLLLAGLSGIDSINHEKSWLMIYKKDDHSFSTQYKISEGIYDRIILPVDCFTPDTLGFITSPVFGPAKKWKEFHWRGTSQEIPSMDLPAVDIIGSDILGNQSILYSVDVNKQDLDISSINAVKYPYLQLKMRNVDSIDLTPFQLKYWRLNYDPIPEGSLAPNLLFMAKDSLEVGEKLSFSIAFKNIGQAAFDSVKIKMIIIGNDNVSHPLNLPRKKPLVSGDTLSFNYTIDTKDYPGTNTLFVDFNPDNDQLEQYHYNNFLYRNFYVKPDKTNPLLDVTFDGVHILNRDIISAKPRIQIKLKDEARYMLLNDTSLLTVQVRFPDPNRTLRTFAIDNDTLKFIPAQSGNDNTASIEFMPYFSQQYNSEGDDYELIVSGKDKSGNKAGQIEYHVTFRIINKPMISNLLNYPNPFTTSTAFVFTITGSEIPQNMKIQVLTVTGKIVREITKDELGALHIGRNITEFKWNGTDQFGQRLANGVYIYRVVTTLNGRQMDKYKATDDNTDKYFNRGYGKMYLMR
ncbi:MAG: C25 family cysteine peptidase [Chitinophagaceae bacterium]